MPQLIQNILRWPSSLITPYPLTLPRLPDRPRLRLASLFFLLYGLSGLVLRTVLMIRSWEQIGHGPLKLAAIFGVGLFYDLVSATYCSIPLILTILLLPRSFFASRYQRLLLEPAAFLLLYGLGFAALAEWFFWDEFGSRFNFIAVDYLVYTHEVLGNIRESYPLPALLGGLLAAALPLFALLRPWLTPASRPRPARKKGQSLAGRMAGGIGFLLLPLVFLLTVDSSLTAVFSNRYEQELAANGIYQLFAAFRNNVLDYNSFYLTHDDSSVYQGLHRLLNSANSSFRSPDPTDISRLISSPGPEKRPNVVLIMEESLSAEFLGAFGNKQGLTPNLDRMASQGLLFTRLYATGTRTVRGMEAVTLSVPPTPGRSIVKRPDNANMYSLGFLFRDKGYDTKFFYGGYGYFDNMNGFFGNNGFTVIDRTDLGADEVHFANVWGVCDEDILNRAIREFDLSHSNGQPFLGYVMTTSNHRPYTYPEGRIDIPSHTGRFGGVKYSDYALGAFMAEASRHPWFANTIFVIVADHCAGSSGRQELPVHRYHIPLLFYGPGLVPTGTNNTLASQVDVVPTLLGLLHWQYESKLFGQDILQPDFAPRAYIGNYQKLGYLKDGYLTILDERHQVRNYRLLHETLQESVLEESPPLGPLTDEAVAAYQGASLLYKNHLNRWP